MFIRLIVILYLISNLFVLSKGYGQEKILLPDSTQLHHIKLIDSSLYFVKKAPRKSQHYLKKTLNISKELLTPKILFKIYNNYGLSYYFLGNMDSSIYYYNASLKQAESIDAKHQTAIALKNLGIAYRVKSLYDQAIDHYQRALQVNQVLDNHKEIASINNSIGNVYHSIQYDEKAIQYYEKALSTWKNYADSSRVSKAYNNLGIAHAGIQHEKQAINYYHLAISYNNQNDKAYKNLGESYLSINQFDSAVNHLNKAYTMRKASGEQNSIASVLNQFGELFRKQRKFKKGNQFLEKASNILQETGDKSLLLENLKFKKHSLKDQGKYREALALADKIYSLDSLLFKEQKLDVLELQSFYDLKVKENEKQILALEKESEKQLLAQENEIIKISNQQKTVELRNTIYIVILLIVIAVLLYFAVRASNKKNEMLKQHNQLIRYQKDEIAHRNANGLNRIVILLRNLSRERDNIGLKNELHLVEKMVFGLANLESHLFTNQNEQIVSTYFEKLINEIDKSFKLPNQRINYQLEIEDFPCSTNVLTALSLIVTELTINSLKHAFINNEGIISISLKQDEGVFLSYQDDGIGISKSAGNHSKGIKIIEDLVRQVKGEVLHLSSAEENGTSFKFLFPINEIASINS